VAGNRPLHTFSAGFIEAHRLKIFLGLSVAGTLLLGPFAVNNFFQDRLLLGVITSAFVLCLVANALCIARGRSPVVPALAIFAGSALGLATAMYNNGLIGILWVYPGIMLFHFMLPRRQANVLNISLVLLTIPFAWMHLGPQLTTRVGVTLTLLIVFSNIFSHIADTQQKKEAEQRGKLDEAVRQLEAQNTALREAFRLREEVERIARHDLKTPLASIASVPRLLRERHALDPTEDELLGMVEHSAQRVLRMVNLSLDLFRMEEGSYRLRAQAVDLGKLARTVARELRAHADSKRVRLALDLPPKPLYAQGEELLCYSTLANLLKNALEASPEASEVRVTLRLQSDENGDCVALDVHNDGQVPEELRPRFFEKYATHGKADGTGLGAYSARLMARVQRGALRMNSDGSGTTLSLRLPQWHAAAPVATELAPPAQDLASAASLAPMEVLVVDDDEYNVVVLKNLLPSPPLAVRTAVNGLAALACVREARADVIFMDVEMPVLGGLEAVRRIRALEQEQGGPRSFIAAFSAHDDEDTRSACQLAGFDVYLAKPASREEVLAVLHRQDPARVVGRPGGVSGARVEPGLLALLPQFLDSRRSMARELAFAVRDGKRDEVRDTAHKLAGSLAMYGFKDASRVSLDLERAASTEDIARLQARCAQLTRMLADAQPP
jgi:signal transduction histidine kinase/CheY-like chemotaxis protein